MTTPTSEPTPPTAESPPAPVAPSPAATLPTSKPHEIKNVPWPQVLMSLMALACWILLYAAGLLMESIEERILLAPHTMEKQLGPTNKELVDEVIRRARESERTPAAAAREAKGKDAKTESGKDGEKTTAPVTSAEILQKAEQETTADKAAVKSDARRATRQPVSRVTAFFYATLVYTPTNMALLTLFAGFLGGCVSNIKYSMLTKDERASLKPKDEAIMSENPLSATMRGFVIYLCLVAGLYVALDDPFKDSTPGQYARLAGSMSLVAFIVGFDPTRIRAWLRMADSKSNSDSSNPPAGSPAPPAKS